MRVVLAAAAPPPLTWLLLAAVEDWVPVVSLDSLSLPALHLLKLDVEGGELAALRGSLHTLARLAPYVYFENDSMDPTPVELLEAAAPGYRCYLHAPRLFRRDNYARTDVNVFGDTSSLNVLCVPPGGVAVAGLPRFHDAAARVNVRV